jgi:hypothetical protein
MVMKFICILLIALFHAGQSLKIIEMFLNMILINFQKFIFNYLKILLLVEISFFISTCLTFCGTRFASKASWSMLIDEFTG